MNNTRLSTILEEGEGEGEGEEGEGVTGLQTPKLVSNKQTQSLGRRTLSHSRNLSDLGLQTPKPVSNIQTQSIGTIGRKPLSHSRNLSDLGLPNLSYLGNDNNRQIRILQPNAKFAVNSKQPTEESVIDLKPKRNFTLKRKIPPKDEIPNSVLFANPLYHENNILIDKLSDLPKWAYIRLLEHFKVKSKPSYEKFLSKLNEIGYTITKITYIKNLDMYTVEVKETEQSLEIRQKEIRQKLSPIMLTKFNKEFVLQKEGGRKTRKNRKSCKSCKNKKNKRNKKNKKSCKNKKNK